MNNFGLGLFEQRIKARWTDAANDAGDVDSVAIAACFRNGLSILALDLSLVGMQNLMPSSTGFERNDAEGLLVTRRRCCCRLLFVAVGLSSCLSSSSIESYLTRDHFEGLNSGHLMMERLVNCSVRYIQLKFLKNLK